MIIINKAAAVDVILSIVGVVVDWFSVSSVLIQFI